MILDHVHPSDASRRRFGAGLVGGLLLAAGVAVSVGAGPTTAIVPGTNGRIVFESNRNGDNEIFAMNPDGSAPVNLTLNKDATDVFPSWSNDSSKITFASDRHELGNLDVYVMNADGSGVTQLTNSPGEDRATSWTSDGAKIVFHSARLRDATHAFDIFTMNADGSDETRILTNGSAAYVCGNSTDGIIVFNSSGDLTGQNPPVGGVADFEIFTMDMQGGNVQQITDNTVLDSGPKWSPDCSEISYNSLDSGGSLDVHRVDADGSDDVNLTNAPGVFDAFSAWSPDGAQVVFSSNRTVNFELFTIASADGSGITQLTASKKGDANLRADWGTNPPFFGPPIHKEWCKKDVWADFTSPSFADQAACVAYVNAHD